MPQVEKHSSKSFDADLESVISDFIIMGELAAEQVTNATHALIDSNIDLAQQVIARDDEIDKLEKQIDEKILLLVAKRQPTANDLRFVMAITKGVVDLERVGDEATKIAQMSVQLMDEGTSPRGYSEVQHVSNQVRLMLLDALNAFMHLNPTEALAVLQSNSMVDTEHQSASRSLMTYVMEDSRHVSKVINILWVLRSLERVGDHACNIAELVIFSCSGTDVRHTDYDVIEQAVQHAESRNSE